MSGPRTSVIVVSYRPGQWLRPCIDSVTGQADEVIVVDNGSPGGEASAVARSAGARTVVSSRNRGFAGGVAAGLAQVRGEIVGVLNDDAEARPGWVESAAALLGDQSVAAVTPKVVLAGQWAEVLLDEDGWRAPGDARLLGRQLRSVTVAGEEVLTRCLGAGLHDLETDPANPSSRWRWTHPGKAFYVPEGQGGEVRLDGEPVPTRSVGRLVNHAGSFLLGHGVAGEYGLGAPDDGRFDQRAERFGFSGTAPVFRAETLARLGSFAEPFFAYNEDTDWCLRARLQGQRILYDPGAAVDHRLSASSGGSTSVRVQHLAQRNALLCLIRNAPVAVARPQVVERLRRDWRGPVGRSLLRLLPWALATRVQLSRRWTSTPDDVWAEWVGRDSAWDDSPRRPETTSPEPSGI